MESVEGIPDNDHDPRIVFKSHAISYNPGVTAVIRGNLRINPSYVILSDLLIKPVRKYEKLYNFKDHYQTISIPVKTYTNKRFMTAKPVKIIHKVKGKSIYKVKFKIIELSNSMLNFIFFPHKQAENSDIFDVYISNVRTPFIILYQY